MKKGDGRVLSYGGQAAAAAAKWGRPLDLRAIAARIDAGEATEPGCVLRLATNRPLAEELALCALPLPARRPALQLRGWQVQSGQGMLPTHLCPLPSIVCVVACGTA